MNGEPFHATGGPITEYVLGRFQMDYPLSNFEASDAASAIARAADVALIVDHAGIVQDVAVNSDELSKAGVGRWIGQHLSDLVTVESRPKIDSLMADDATELRRWRQVNHPVVGSDDIPVEYAVIHISADQRILAGRELSGIAQLQQRLIAAQQSIEREYARVRGVEARYRTLFQLTSEAVLIVDAATENVVEANPAAIALLQAKSPRNGSIAFGNLLAAPDAASVEGLFATVRATGNSETASLRAASGRTIAIVVSMFNQSGKAFFLVRVRDTEDGEAAAGKPSPLVELVDRMPEGFVICDAKGEIISANAAFVELTQNVAIEQVRGEPISRWIGRTGVDTNLLLGALAKHDAVQRFATVVRDEHGGTEHVEIAAVSVMSLNGDKLYGLSLRTIRPEALSAASGLERSVEHLAGLVGSVPLKDLVREATDLIERMCIEAALRLTDDNRASAAEILGLSRQSLYNKMRRYDLLAPGTEFEG